MYLLSKSLRSSCGFRPLQLVATLSTGILLSLVPRGAASVAYMQASTSVPSTESICEIGGTGSQPPCEKSFVDADFSSQGGGRSYSAASARADLASGQLKTFSYGDEGQAVGAYASFQDQLALRLAEGASWPQSVTVRAVLSGAFRGDYRAGVTQGNSFGLEVHTGSQSIISAPFEVIYDERFYAAYEGTLEITEDTTLYIAAHLNSSARTPAGASSTTAACRTTVCASRWTCPPGS